MSCINLKKYICNIYWMIKKTTCQYCQSPSAALCLSKFSYSIVFEGHIFFFCHMNSINCCKLIVFYITPPHHALSHPQKRRKKQRRKYDFLNTFELFLFSWAFICLFLFYLLFLWYACVFCEFPQCKKVARCWFFLFFFASFVF